MAGKKGMLQNILPGISSDFVTAFPAYAAYSATKFAVRAMTQSAGKIDFF